MQACSQRVQGVWMDPLFSLFLKHHFKSHGNVLANPYMKEISSIVNNKLTLERISQFTGFTERTSVVLLE